MPYNINQVTQSLALEALENQDKMNQMIQDCLAQRTFLETELAKIPSVRKVYPSDTNFLLIQIVQATEVYNYLITKGIIVRNRSNVALCEDCLRISVGTKEENKTLLRELQNMNL